MKTTEVKVERILKCLQDHSTACTTYLCLVYFLFFVCGLNSRGWRLRAEDSFEGASVTL